MSLRLAVAAVAVTIATGQAPCCAYGGSGGATRIADGSLVLPGPGGTPGTRATLATVALGAGESSRGNGFTSVLVGTQAGPESAAAGWIIEQNATGQTLTFWYGNDGSAGAPPPSCYRGYVAFPDFYSPSVKMCCGGGGNGGAFTDFLGNYMIGTQKASWFSQNASSPHAAMLSVTDVGCAPVMVLGSDTPLGGGSFAFAVQGGGADSAPAAWADAPAACSF